LCTDTCVTPDTCNTRFLDQQVRQMSSVEVRRAIFFGSCLVIIVVTIWHCYGLSIHYKVSRVMLMLIENCVRFQQDGESSCMIVFHAWFFSVSCIIVVGSHRGRKNYNDLQNQI
jgi:hypothetical protein